MSESDPSPSDLPSRPAKPVARRPRVPRSPSGPSATESPKSRKVSFYLSPDAIRRLGVVASMEDTDRSALLERIIAESPLVRRWVVSDRAKPQVSASEPAGQGGATDPK